eukprot:1159516-Pelagomonas_calceolata.AAC.6
MACRPIASSRPIGWLLTDMQCGGCCWPGGNYVWVLSAQRSFSAAGVGAWSVADETSKASAWIVQGRGRCAGTSMRGAQAADAGDAGITDAAYVHMRVVIDGANAGDRRRFGVCGGGTNLGCHSPMLGEAVYACMGCAHWILGVQGVVAKWPLRLSTMQPL